MPSKRAKLFHPNPEEARALSAEDEQEPEVDEVEEDEKEPEEEDEEGEEEEVIEEFEEEEGAEEDEQKEILDGTHTGQHDDVGEKPETDAEDEEEEEVEEVEEEEDDADKEEIEDDEDGDTERGEIEEEEEDLEADHVQGEEVEGEEKEIAEGYNNDVGYMDEYADDAEEDVDEADEDAHDAVEDVYDADEDAIDAVEDVDDADEDNEANDGDDKHRKKLTIQDDDGDEDDNGGGDFDDDDDDDGDGGGGGDDDDDHHDGDGDDECRKDHGDSNGDDDEDAEDERRKQLAILMCFSSLQTLMAMELCRDTTPPFDEICTEDSTMVPVAFLKLMLLAVTSLMQEEGRQCWKLQRSGQEWTHIERGVSSIDAATRDSIWRRKYSMSYACFLYLVEELRPFIQSESQMYVRAPVEIERAVAMVLYRLAHGLSAREVAEKYNVGASTVGKYTLIVASALAEANKLYGRYVAIPTSDRLARITSQFQQITNVSQMCGAIDGTHIKLYFKPDKWNSPSDYRSPRKFHSILLQAVCDANKLFWDVCCMAPGGAHDAAHFISSNLYQKMKDGLSLQEPILTLENREVTPYMVGDSAYPIRPFLIKPFDTDDALRRAFDEQLRKGSACIDGAFLLLKARWKILKCMNVHLMHAPRIAVACCVLHNICQLWGEPEPSQQPTEAHSNEHSQGSAAAYEIDEAAKVAGEAAREALFRDWVKRSLDHPYVAFDQENMFSGQS